MGEETVISHITRKSRMIIVNSPNNPAGSAFSPADLSKLANIAKERDLIVISDEVYEKITYDDFRHYCMAVFLVCVIAPLLLDRSLKRMP